MKVFLTGASGFVGAHTARALLERGHALRLLVRNPDPVKAYFARHGHEVRDLVVADMRDGERVRQGMQGCEAVLHAAALVSLDPRRAGEVYRNNLDAIGTVLGAACELGIGRIVHVSSLSVLFQDGITVIDENTPLGNPREPYARSKRDGDEHVRRMQEAGRPVQMSYPSGVIGPDDPKLSEGNGGVAKFAKGPIPLTSSGFQAVDVRDLAQVHAWMLENPAAKPVDGRYVVAGPFLTWAELHRVIEQVTGRSVPDMPVPGAVLRAMGVLADLARKVVPFESQVSAEAMKYATQWILADARRIESAARLSWQDSEQTYADTIRWLAEAGHLPRKFAGKLAAA